MKTIQLVFALLIMSLVTFAGGPKPETVKIKTSAICEMCKERIEKNLAFTKGVVNSNLDLTDKVVTVTYNPKKTDAAKIKAAIANSGYDADDVTADAKSYDKLPSCCKKDGEAMHH